MAQNNTASDFGDKERIFETKITLEVLGHLVGASTNDLRQKVSVRENRVSIVMTNERVIFDPDNPKYKKRF
ncbi:MAG: hypothetical protein AABX29_06670 [Nanoarchaeota archaeon]